MSAVADIFDRDGDGYIDYYEFVAALHPNKDAYKPLTDADKIEDEVVKVVKAAVFDHFSGMCSNNSFSVSRLHVKLQNANVQNDSKWSKLEQTNTG